MKDILKKKKEKTSEESFMTALRFQTLKQSQVFDHFFWERSLSLVHLNLQPCYEAAVKKKRCLLISAEDVDCKNFDRCQLFQGKLWNTRALQEISKSRLSQKHIPGLCSIPYLWNSYLVPLWFFVCSKCWASSSLSFVLAENNPPKSCYSSQKY